MSKKLAKLKEKYHINIKQLDYDDAFKIVNEIKLIQKKTLLGMVTIGKYLAEIHWGRGWFALSFDSFEDWLASPEIAIGRRNAYNFILLYLMWQAKLAKLFTDNPDLLGTPYTKIVQVLPKIKELSYENKKEKEEIKLWIHHAKALSTSDLTHLTRGTEPQLTLSGSCVMSKYLGNTITLAEVEHGKNISNQSLFDYYGHKKKLKFKITLEE